MTARHAGESRPTSDDALLPTLDDDTIIALFAYACGNGDEKAADSLEAELERRGIYGRRSA